MAGPLVSKASLSDPAPDNPPTLLQHLRTELNSKDPMRRDLALVDIIALGRCATSCTVPLASIQGKKVNIETDAGTVIDLDVLSPDLIRVYQSGPADGHRLMALAALINIGNQETLRKVVEVAPSQSADVKRATNQTLAAFYLEKYPELMERAQRRGRLTLEEVDRAERVRVQLARKQAKQGN